MRKFRKSSFVLISCFICISVSAVLFVRLFDNKSTQTKPSYQMYRIKNVESLVISGKVVPDDSELLDIPAGEISRINVKDNQRVNAGDLILSTYDTDKDIQKNTLNNSLNQSKRELTALDNKIADLKMQILKSTDAEEKKGLDNTLNDYKTNTLSQRENIELLQRQITAISQEVYTNLVAPYAGTVLINSDDSKNPKIKLYSYNRHIELSVGEYDFDKVKDGQTVEVTSLSTNSHLTSKVSSVSEIPNSTNKQNISEYNIRVSANDVYKLGETVNVQIPQKGIFVPAQSIIKQGSNLYVWKSDTKKHYHLKRIDAKKKNGNYELESGLSPGDNIIENAKDKRNDKERQ